MVQLNWNDRYSDPDYAYGTEPNSFLAEHVELLSGPVLSIAEGEGRNAVFLASRGLSVHAVDGSEIGLAKATKLAEWRGVNIETQVASLEHFEPRESAYNAIVSIYAHLPSLTRQKLYPWLVRSLKPGGICILEAYSESQRGRGTGGPSDLDLLMTCSKVKSEFPGLETVMLHKIDRDVREGKFHTGMASVVQFIGRKRV